MFFCSNVFATQFGAKDLALEIAAGRVTGKTAVNKYGRAPSGVQTSKTDIWDRADATPTQQIWTAPTQARVHNITSSSTSDDGDPTGTGARTIRVWGLTSWSTAETSEDITMDGTSNVATSNSYVIIHRMRVLTHGTAGPNVGIITATAQTDGTVTAQINAGVGQTNMAIYGIPSAQTAYMTYFECNAHEQSAPATAVDVDFEMLVNYSPDVDETVAGFINKSNKGTRTTGSSDLARIYNPYFKIPGPAIVKFQGISSSADADASVEFDLIVEDN